MARLGFLLVILATGTTLAATPLDNAIRLSLAESYVTASLLSSGDAVRFGFWDFDPNSLFNLDNDDFGSLEAQQRRQRLTTFSLPITWETTVGVQEDILELGAKAAYVESAQETQLVSSSSRIKDTITNSVTSLSAGASLTRRVSPQLALSSGLNGHWMRYDNDTDFNTAASRPLAPLVDGLITNYTTDAWLAEPHVGATYFIDGPDSEVQLFSDYHYMSGHTYHADQAAHDVQPEAWYWANGVRWRHPVVSHLLPGQNAWLRAARYDLGGDLDGPLGNHYYFEAGVGWLLDLKGRLPYVENIGIGVNLNYGSLLRGGTLVLLFNEE
ncbi:MAG: Solitary outer membrane autotransporter beta-barrel domain [Pseudomonadales bacterium]|nr:Solitary outer membrane autotransporter beta-barrel domain [Pseudomonadales bacterium]